MMFREEEMESQQMGYIMYPKSHRGPALRISRELGFQHQAVLGEMELAKTWSLPHHSNSGFFPHVHSQRPPLEVALTLVQSEEQDVEAQAGHQGTQRHLPPTTQRVLITRRPERQPNPDMRGGGHRGPRRNTHGPMCRRLAEE